MKCFTCGAEIFDGIKICPRCGTAQPKNNGADQSQIKTGYEDYQPVQAYKPVAPPQQYTLSVNQYQAPEIRPHPAVQQPQPVLKKKKKAPFIVLIVVFVMLASLVAAYLLYPWGDLDFGYIENNRYVNNSVGLVIETTDEYTIKQPTDDDYTSNQILSAIEYDSKNKRYYYTEKNVNQREYFEAYVSSTQNSNPAGIEVFYFDGNVNARAGSLDSKTIADRVKSGKAFFNGSSINVKCENSGTKSIGNAEYDCYDYTGSTDIDGVNVKCEFSVAVHIAGNDAMVIMLSSFSVNGGGVDVDSLYSMLK